MSPRGSVSTAIFTRPTPNPIVLSGDVHTHWGADLKVDFANPKSATVGVEFTNTSITSGGDGRDTAADWDQIRSNNPQILYHSARRGYIACAATPATMRADFKIVDSVSTPNAPVKTGGSVLVEGGRPGGVRA
jgi:alkaline phosphatase D